MHSIMIESRRQVKLGRSINNALRQLESFYKNRLFYKSLLKLNCIQLNIENFN